MKTQVSELLEKFGVFPCQFTCCKSTTNSHGCSHFPKKNHEDLSRFKPILIGDVLEKMYELWRDGKGFSIGISRNKVLDLWAEFGFTKSLQELIEESGWEEGYIHDGQFVPSECTVETERLKDPHTLDLFELLISLFLSDNK